MGYMKATEEVTNKRAVDRRKDERWKRTARKVDLSNCLFEVSAPHKDLQYLKWNMYIDRMDIFRDQNCAICIRRVLRSSGNMHRAGTEFKWESWEVRTLEELLMKINGWNRMNDASPATHGSYDRAAAPERRTDLVSTSMMRFKKSIKFEINNEEIEYKEKNMQ